MALQGSNLESLLEKAKELEKKYEWFQAAKNYKKASKSLSEAKDFLNASELQNRAGFCYYRAAMQTKTNVKFRSVLKHSILAYEKESKLLEGINREEYQVKIQHAQAMIAYVGSWHETDPEKVKSLLDKWWNLENQVLEDYKSIGNIHSVGVVCNDLIEYSQYTRLWLSTHSEEIKLEKEAQSLAEKAIQALLKSGDNYELARAYCFASIWYCSQSHGEPEFAGKRAQLIKKGYDYSKKALVLSSKTEDAWLISCAYHSACVAAIWYGHNYDLAVDYGEEAKKYAIIAKDNLLLSCATWYSSYATRSFTVFLENPDKQRTCYEKAGRLGQECIRLSQIINYMVGICWGCFHGIGASIALARSTTDPEKKQKILQNATNIARECLEILKGWSRLPGILYNIFGASLRLLSEEKNDVEKKALLLEAQSYQRRQIVNNEEFVPFLYFNQSWAYYALALVQIDLAKTETEKTGKIDFFEKAITNLEKSDELLTKEAKLRPKTNLIVRIEGDHSNRLGRILQEIYYLSSEEKTRCRAIEAYKNAVESFMKGELPAHAAESYWSMAQLQGQKGEHQVASKNYESASQAYAQAANKIPQLKDFYNDYSSYMQAWNQIEQAKYTHSIEEYSKAKEHYKKSAEIHESTEQWSYLVPNYFAWASVEEAENLSRKENTQQAKQTFQKALEQFGRAEESFKQKLEEITSSEEKEMAEKLFAASYVRQKYCQVRILLEEGKLLDRDGKHLQSSTKYREAAQNISIIVDKIDVEAERKELEYIAILCQAWEKMADAEEATSAESYLDAAELFEQAKGYCFTKKASLWALGNSNFCKGLAAGLQYKSSLDLADHAKAKGYITTASTDYLQAGFMGASEYAKATQRLFDAYLSMNQAEMEADQEKRAKQYQMAENQLQIAADSFIKAKQPEKTAQVQAILVNVREEKTLATSLSRVMQAPTIASSTMSFTTPTPTSEASVGLEKFEHANVQANLVTNVKQVKVGESFCLSVEFVNAGREPALLMRVDDFVPSDFVVVKKPEIYRIEETCLNMKGKQLAPLKLVEVKLTLQPSKKGEYTLNPRVQYLDELGQNKSLQLKTLEINVEEVILENRMTTGTEEVDSLLLGGIPQGYAVVLSGSPCDERELMVKNFLEAGAKEEVTFYIATEANNLEGLLENPNFYLFLCNPKPKTNVPDLPNVYKLQSKADITNLGIALTKAIRSIGKSMGNKRICVEILSDVLVKHGINTTREWVSGLITNYGAKGFTMLAIVNPRMHASEELYAVIDLFDGEISITQSDDPLDCKKSILVKKLRNQDYIKNPICLR